MELKTVVQSALFSRALRVVACAIVLLLVFKTGVIVGERRSGFSARWGDNYHRNFAGPREGFGGFYEKKEYIDAHGVFGQILKVDGAALVITGKDGAEKIVVINSETKIKKFKENVMKETLKVDDVVVVVGEPNDAGQIEAKLIRLMPPPPSPGENRGFPMDGRRHR
jgi:hypothetical protein